MTPRVQEAVRPAREAAEAAPDAARRLREQALEPGAQKVAERAVPATKQVTDGAPCRALCCRRW